MVVGLFSCPGGLKDKAADSGSADVGSIPVRDANKSLAMQGFCHVYGVRCLYMSC